MDSGADDLRAKYLQALPGLKDVPPTVHPEDLWRLFVEHPWFQQQLRRCAKHALRIYAAPRDWLGDIEHEALLTLARKLRTSPDLHIDPALAERHFPGWIRTIVSRDCLAAMRKLHRQQQSTWEIREGDRLIDDQQLREDLVDVSMALERLPDRERTAVLLYSKGYTTAEIARDLRLSLSTAHRTVHRGLRHAQELLEGGSGGP